MLLLKNCMVKDEVVDVGIDGKTIVAIGKGLEAEGAAVVEVGGKTLLPAFVDMHTHLREPGYEYKEDIASGAAAAVKGGFSAIACMPNTLPICDNAAVVGYIRQRAKEVDLCKVYPVGAITKGEQGEELAEMGKMKEAGAVAVSDDGRPVERAVMMRHAIEYASDFGLPVLSHCEDKSLAEGGSVNEGYYSMLTGLKGISAASEEIMASREILLAEALNRPVHLCHISTKGTVRMVREAKARGVRVTAETCPHYFAADDSMVATFDARTKVNPPLRGLDDVAAIKAGLQDGTIDAIVTDHAPHAFDEKNVEYQLAAFGISGIETSFALSYTNLVETGLLSLEKLSELMTTNPAKILGIPYGEIKEGGLADLVVVDLGAEWVIDPADFRSKGKNTPFAGRRVHGKVLMTLVEGQIKYKEA